MEAPLHWRRPRSIPLLLVVAAPMASPIQEGGRMLDMPRICADLQDEQEDLDRILSGLSETEWGLETPAVGWTVRDQVRHIGATDSVATIAASQPERFTAEILTQDRADRMAQQLAAGRSMPGRELLVWWRQERRAMLEALRTLPAKARIPWFGPAMSAVSFATARLMETWAHGQDIVDTLGLYRSATERLRHVAHIGVLARPFSYTVRGLTPPTDEVRVELHSPTGALWTWGEAEAPHCIRGAALDFCLVVTQRRHVADTRLQLCGFLAEEWMRLAQAFAGPPGAGRQPGQFPPPVMPG
jgi:uncharacterized protein (TIGR03084 family)